MKLFHWLALILVALGAFFAGYYYDHRMRIGDDYYLRLNVTAMLDEAEKLLRDGKSDFLETELKKHLDGKVVLTRQELWKLRSELNTN